MRRGRNDRGGETKAIDPNPMPLKDNPDVDMVRYVIEVGYKDGVKPDNIVGAIANEADIESQFIGHIEIFDDCATVDLPSGMPTKMMSHLKGTRICGRTLNIEDAKKSSKKEGKTRGRSDDGGHRKPRVISVEKAVVVITVVANVAAVKTSAAMMASLAVKSLKADQKAHVSVKAKTTKMIVP